ncbi:Mob1/phocein family [Nakaseomyces glabratus]
MSFFNFKAFGRNSKKNKNGASNLGPSSNAGTPNTSTNASVLGSSHNQIMNSSNTQARSIYSNQPSSSSKLSLRKNQSPTRTQSPSRLSHNNNNQILQERAQLSHSGTATNDTQSLSQRRSNSPERSSSQQVMFLSEPFVKTALVKGSFKTIVQLPKYVDLGEWIALNVFEFFTNLNHFYGVIAEYVTADAYPTMNAGPHTDYLWLDANNRQVSLPAGQYIDLALTWINNKVNDKSLFPTKNGVPFSPNFFKDVQRIMIQMFRIFGHIYHHHFDKIVHLSLEAHWNSFFAHFISFVKEFKIIDRREMYPLMPLIENFEKQGKIIYA